MQISPNSLLQEMQALSGELPMGSIKPQSIQPQDIATQGVRQVTNTNASDFGELLSQAIGHVGELQADAKSLATRLEMGDNRVTLSDTVIAREKSSVAFEATVQVRNKFVEAYKSIMSMTV